MRLRRNRIQEFYLRKREVVQDSEGGKYEEYGKAKSFFGEAWPAGGKVQSEQYGERLGYIYNIKIDGKYHIIRNQKDKMLHYVFPETGLDVVENDGICLFSSRNENPDYRIISIKPYKPLKVEVERI